MTNSYPIISQSYLDPTPKRGFLGLGARERARPEVPRPDAHHALVYRTEGDYELDHGHLGMNSGKVVNANHVCIVDMRHRTPVSVELRIPSRDADEFTARITFVCSVTDAIAVAREGVNAAISLEAYLKNHRRIFELGLDFSIDEINEVRRHVNAQVTAYTTLDPPVINGLSVAMASVEIHTPKEIADLERARRGQQHNHRLVTEGQRLSHTRETDRTRDDQELDYVRKRYVQSMDLQQLQHDQQLASEQFEYRRNEWLRTRETIGDDARNAVGMAWVSGELTARQVAEGLSVDQQQVKAREEVKEDRVYGDDRDDERWGLREQARNAEREHEIRMQQLAWSQAEKERGEASAERERQRKFDAHLALLRLMAERGHIDMINANVKNLLNDIAPGIIADAEEVEPAALPKAPATTDKDSGADLREEDDDA